MSAPLSQVDAAGRLRHLVTLDGLPRTLLESLLDRAGALAASPARSEALRGLTVANLFGEPSTRTRASFELGDRVLLRALLGDGIRSDLGDPATLPRRAK